MQAETLMWLVTLVLRTSRHIQRISIQSWKWRDFKRVSIKAKCGWTVFLFTQPTSVVGLPIGRILLQSMRTRMLILPVKQLQERQPRFRRHRTLSRHPQQYLWQCLHRKD